MANLINDDFNRRYGDENGQAVLDEDRIEDLLEDNPLDMHFVAKKDGPKELWLVFDTLNDNAIVGVHELETLAFLDASKREQDTYLQEPAPQTW